MTSLQDYASHSAISDPAPFGAKMDHDFGNWDVVLRRSRNVILHIIFGAELEPPLPPDRQADRRTRGLSAMLTRILAVDPAALDRERVPHDRFSGTCRDYALLTCGQLRQQGVPARVRVGFADYFAADFWADHWLCEAWDADQGRWRLMDAELDAERCERFAITFDPRDVPRDRFLTAGPAWQALGTGRLDGDRVGIYGTSIKGAWFAAASLLRDLAALNKIELQPWDWWGLGREIGAAMAVEEAWRPLLDEVAEALAIEDPDPVVLQKLGQHPQLRVPDRVLCYPYGEPEEAAIL